MRNQTIKQKHKNTIKNIEPQSSMTHVVSEFSTNDPENIVGLGDQHNASVLERKNEESRREKTSFQDFLRSIPKFRSKALSTPGKLEKNQNF